MKATKKTKANKPKLVTRKFLLDLANRIYNPKTKVALKLCKGKLKNGPDPDDDNRSMHCGLGELHFAITGREPVGVDEQDVVDLAIWHSSLQKQINKEEEDAVKLVKKLKNTEARDLALSAIIDADFDNGRTEKLDDILTDIPEENDSDGIEDQYCDLRNYVDRAKRVAAVFKKAAKLLPA